MNVVLDTVFDIFAAFPGNALRSGLFRLSEKSRKRGEVDTIYIQEAH
jgi:hypothetical protein